MCESFDSLDDMLREMYEREDQANQRVTPDQESIGYGDYFRRVWGGELLIYGQVMPREEFRDGEKNLGSSDAELEWTMTAHDDAHTRGYRFSTCYSLAEPNGEIGSVHVSVMEKITPREFLAAKERGWR